MNELIPLSEIKEMAKHVCSSNLFGMPSPEAAFSLMLLCQADGLHPMQAMRKYHIIKGRPSMRAEAMLAEFQANGGKIQWLERTDSKCSAKFSHPSGGDLVVTWTLDRAKQAGLLSKDNWRQYPCQMLAARCISEGVRAVYPAVVCGIYTPEEVSDFTESPKANNKTESPKANPIEPQPTKVETITEAEIVEETISTAMVVANKIKKARKNLVELGYKNLAQFKEATLKILGRECDNLTTLSPDELDKIIEYKGEN